MYKVLLLCLGVALCAAPGCGAQSAFADTLAARGKLGIPLEEARALEPEVGQLLIVNVDGFGATGPLALEPGFIPLLTRLQIGGVIPHYSSTSYERIRRTNRRLAELTDLPLLICCDIVRLKGKSATASFGDGYVGGFLGRNRRMSDEELSVLARLNGFALAAIGVNVALGPTVDASTGDARTEERARLVLAELQGFGLQVVLKHFPYLPPRANLHRESPDTRLSIEEAEGRFSIFRQMAADADIMMTTHFFDSKVDRSLVTFSSPWIDILRKRTGFKGLLMSDGLLMLKNYADRSALAGDPALPGTRGMDEAALWAVRAILAGHDMVIVEGSAAQTERVFQGLLSLACQDSPLGRTLKARIEESSARIARWKRQHAGELRRVVDVPLAAVQAAISLVPPEGADLTSFRFDSGSLARLEPSLAAARDR